MKRFITMLAGLLLLSAAVQAKTGKKKSMPNGLYLIVNMDTTGAPSIKVSNHETVLKFSKLFDDYNEDSLTRIVVNTGEYVPLELEKPPVTEQQTEEKKKLLLTLTPAASEKLKTFTAVHVMQRVAIVVNGEVLTVHKIKEPITSGLLQITRCNDNACERLYVQLKGNVKKR